MGNHFLLILFEGVGHNNRITEVIFDEELLKMICSKYKQACNFIPNKTAFCVKIIGLGQKATLKSSPPWKKNASSKKVLNPFLQLEYRVLGSCFYILKV